MTLPAPWVGWYCPPGSAHEASRPDAWRPLGEGWTWREAMADLRREAAHRGLPPSSWATAMRRGYHPTDATGDTAGLIAAADNNPGPSVARKKARTQCRRGDDGRTDLERRVLAALPAGEWVTAKVVANAVDPMRLRPTFHEGGVHNVLARLVSAGLVVRRKAKGGRLAGVYRRVKAKKEAA